MLELVWSSRCGKNHRY